MCNYAGSPRWLPCVVKIALGPVSYQGWEDVEETPGSTAVRSVTSNDDNQVEDVIDFALSEPTVTVDIPPTRCSTRVRRPPDKLTM